MKTISPEKVSDQVIVKSQGNFEQLLIVRIDENFEFAGKLIDRDELADGGGGFSRRACRSLVTLDDRQNPIRSTGGLSLAVLCKADGKRLAAPP